VVSAAVTPVLEPEHHPVTTPEDTVYIGLGTLLLIIILILLFA